MTRPSCVLTGQEFTGNSLPRMVRPAILLAVFPLLLYSCTFPRDAHNNSLQIESSNAYDPNHRVDRFQPAVLDTERFEGMVYMSGDSIPLRLLTWWTDMHSSSETGLIMVGLSSFVPVTVKWLRDSRIEYTFTVAGIRYVLSGTLSNVNGEFTNDEITGRVLSASSQGSFYLRSVTRSYLVRLVELDSGLMIGTFAAESLSLWCGIYDMRGCRYLNASLLRIDSTDSIITAVFYDSTYTLHSSSSPYLHFVGVKGACIDSGHYDCIRGAFYASKTLGGVRTFRGMFEFYKEEESTR
jgi:hypothetical protein